MNVDSIVKRPITSVPEWLGWRRPNMNSSEISALTGDHQFLTRYGLWMLKSGKIEPDQGNEETDRGNWLEPLALKKTLKDHPDWRHLEEGKFYYSHPVWRIGASPDAVILRPTAADPLERVLLEIKTTTSQGFQKYWNDGPPLYVVDQVRVGMWLTGCARGVIACMVITYSGALRMEYFDIEQEEKRLHVLQTETSNFWRSVENNQPPEPDFGRDLDLIQKAIPNGSDIDLSHDNEVLNLRDKFLMHKFSVSQSELRMKEIKGQMLHKMRGAARAIVHGEVIAVVGTVKKKAHTVKESTYQTFKFTETESA